MIDVNKKKCKTHMCLTKPGNKYEGYCLFCFINTFPDKPISRNYKTKETSVVDFIKTAFLELSWITDKKIQNGSSRRRPDILLDLGHQVLIIEIDENQHTNYDCSCENKRLMELSEDVKHKPIIFIRFNPDDYMKKNKKITSCWKPNVLGILVVDEKKKIEWNKRLFALKDQIKYWINPKNKTDKTVEIIQLYFDE